MHRLNVLKQLGSLLVIRDNQVITQSKKGETNESTKAMDAKAPNTPLKTEKNIKLDRPVLDVDFM